MVNDWCGRCRSFALFLFTQCLYLWIDCGMIEHVVFLNIVEWCRWFKRFVAGGAYLKRKMHIVRKCKVLTHGRRACGQHMLMLPVLTLDWSVVLIETSLSSRSGAMFLRGMDMILILANFTQVAILGAHKPLARAYWKEPLEAFFLTGVNSFVEANIWQHCNFRFLSPELIVQLSVYAFVWYILYCIYCHEMYVNYVHVFASLRCFCCIHSDSSLRIRHTNTTIHILSCVWCWYVRVCMSAPYSVLAIFWCSPSKGVHLPAKSLQLWYLRLIVSVFLWKTAFIFRPNKPHPPPSWPDRTRGRKHWLRIILMGLRMGVSFTTTMNEWTCYTMGRNYARRNAMECMIVSHVRSCCHA